MEFRNYITSSKMYLAYNYADIIIVPSKLEGPFGMVALEALACDVPVLARNVGGMKEIIKNGVNGYLFENDLVEKINMALSCDFINLRDYAKNYSWDKSAKILLNEICYN